MRKCILIMIIVLVILLSSCSSSNISYQIPLSDFQTDTYNGFQSEHFQSYLTLIIINNYIDRISINNIVTRAPEDFKLQVDSKMYINFEVNGYQICNNDLESNYDELLSNAVYQQSCEITLFDSEILKSEFMNETIEIYIFLRYHNTEGDSISEKKLYAYIYGDLIIYAN